MTAEDLWKLKRIGAPFRSRPTGPGASVDVTSWDIDKDESDDATLAALDRRQDAASNSPSAPASSGGPRWSPDGRAIAFTSKRAGDDVAQVYLISPSGGEARRVSSMAVAPSGIKWSPDSKTIYSIGWTWPDAPDDAAHRAKEKALQAAIKSKAVIIDDAQFRVWDKWISDDRRPMIFATDVATGNHRNLLAKSGPFPSPRPSRPPLRATTTSPPTARSSASSATPPRTTAPTTTATSTPSDSTPTPPSRRTSRRATSAGDSSPAYSPDGKHLAFLRQTVKYFYADRQRLMLLDRSPPAPRRS